MVGGKGKLNSDRRTGGAAFLLAQVGAQAARRFSERMAVIGLTPADAGLLRKMVFDPGVSQQVLAAHLGVMPSRMVALVDGLEEKGLVKRRRNPVDRRNYELSLTDQGRVLMEQIRQMATEHEEEFCAPLNKEERAQLSEFLMRLGAAQGLTPGVHPGYRSLGNSKRESREPKG